MYDALIFASPGELFYKQWHGDWILFSKIRAQEEKEKVAHEQLNQREGGLGKRNHLSGSESQPGQERERRGDRKRAKGHLSG